MVFRRTQGFARNIIVERRGYALRRRINNPRPQRVAHPQRSDRADKADLLVTGSLITMDDTGHDHAGAECLVCNTQGNVRVRLFELLEQGRTGAVPAFTSVVIDARRAADPQAVLDALVPGRLPAFGLRDHTVGRSFRLESSLPAMQEP